MIRINLLISGGSGEAGDSVTTIGKQLLMHRWIAALGLITQSILNSSNWYLLQREQLYSK